jgi:signal transduction histidine kinase
LQVANVYILLRPHALELHVNAATARNQVFDVDGGHRLHVFQRDANVLRSLGSLVLDGFEEALGLAQQFLVGWRGGLCQFRFDQILATGASVELPAHSALIPSEAQPVVGYALAVPLCSSRGAEGILVLTREHQKRFTTREQRTVATAAGRFARTISDTLAQNPTAQPANEPPPARNTLLAQQLAAANDEIARLKTELAQRDTALHQAQELDRKKSNFVSTIAHELRTPLAVVRLHSENLRDYAHRISNEQRQAFLADIVSQVEVLSAFTQDMSNLARLGNALPDLRLAEVDVTSVLEEITQQMTPLARKAGVGLHIACPEQSVRLLADGNQIRNVLRNLIGNAIKFTRRGGQVACRVEQSDDCLRFHISDTGIGIPASDLPHIFAPFFRAENALASQVPGSGQGLAIVKHAVEAHGGSLSVESIEGQGSVFTVALPLA